MKYTKEQLIPRVKPYLTEASSVVVTSDGNVFTNDKVGKSYASSHARTNKLEVFEITQEDVKGVLTPAEKKEAQKKADELAEEKRIEAEILAEEKASKVKTTDKK